MITIIYDKARDIAEQINELITYYQEREINVLYVSHDANNITFRIV